MPYTISLKLLQLSSNCNPITRLHHVYRPIKPCDYHKPSNEFYYRLICPLCPPPPKRKPKSIIAKECKLCSFWEQLKDNYCGYFRPIPPMPMKPKGRIYIVKDLREKYDLTEDVAKCLLKRKTLKLHQCDLPRCPEWNWEVARHKPEQ